MAQPPIVYMVTNGDIVTDTTICADTVAAVILGAGMENIAPTLQQRGIAVLSHNDLGICKLHNLDGVYYTKISVIDFKTIRKNTPHYQLGVFCQNSRHRAMLMGENGADFVVFNDADCVSWWATMMEIAVVHDTQSETIPIAKGADFVYRNYA